MFKPVMSYALSVTILLVQAGLPLHMHYCKGMLESISVFINPGCNDHEGIAEASACCLQDSDKSCSSQDRDCCDDEVKLLLQDFDSLLPHFDKWDLVPALASGKKLPVNFNDHDAVDHLIQVHSTDSGPPIYIRLHSLIYYA